MLKINSSNAMHFDVESCSVMSSGISYTKVGYPASARGFEISIAEDAFNGWLLFVGK